MRFLYLNGWRISKLRASSNGAGVSEDVARRITGHQTRAVFSRYNITTDDDLAIAQAAMAAYRERQPKKAPVIKLEKE